MPRKTKLEKNLKSYHKHGNIILSMGIMLALATTVSTTTPFTAQAADVTPPTTTITLNPTNPNGNNNWYVTPVTVQLSATDVDSGVKTLNYKIDNYSWQTIEYANSLNLAPNASMEDLDYSNTPIIKDWTATILDADTTYTRDTGTFADGFATTSAKIITTGLGWHGINNQTTYIVSTPMSNMSASVKLKTQDVTGSAYFKVYVVSQDINGVISYTYVGSSAAISGTTDWTQVSANFVVNSATAIGVYLDIGLDGPGTLWVDAVNVSQSLTTATTTFTIASNGEHTVEYYSSDNSDNAETHSCTSNPKVRCKSIDIDQTPPTNFHDSGANRGNGGGSTHEVFVFTQVEDSVSGLSTNSNKYMYHTELNPSFGRFANLIFCNSGWQANTWVPLGTQNFSQGDHVGELITQRTDFCNSNWKDCKTVRFYVEDVAGNNTTKDFCLNGPWIQFAGGGIVRANGGVNMVSDPESDNADGLVELGNDIRSFFTSSTHWEVMYSANLADYDYDKYKAIAKPAATTITGNLRTTSGVYLFNGNYEIKNTTIPSGFGSGSFNQIYFVNGDLLISNNISVAAGSTALFIVKGNVSIDKSVDEVGVAILADGNFMTAYNIQSGQTTSTLNLNGVYSANKFYFQRTLQGTNNTKYPSESFTYEPKYAIKMRDYLGTNSVKWISSY